MSEQDQKQSHGTQEEWKKQQSGQQQSGQRSPQSDREKFEKDQQKKPA